MAARPDSDELSGKITRVDRNFANVTVVGLSGNARLDTSVARRMTGAYVDNLPSVLSTGQQIKLLAVPYTSESLSKIPNHARQKIARLYRHEVTYFRKDEGLYPLPRRFKDPAQYFTASDGACAGIPPEHVARIVSTLLQILHILDKTSPEKVLQLLKTHFKVKDIPGLHGFLPTPRALLQFVQAWPQYFAQDYGGNLRRCAGFDEDAFNRVFTQRALELVPPGPTLVNTEDIADVRRNTTMVETVEASRRILDPILRQASTATPVVVGLDCEGVKLGHEHGCLTLVQVSTKEGKAYLFDVFKTPGLLRGDTSLKRLLESTTVLKVIHDCKSDAYGLYHDFQATLRNVFDTSIAMRAIMEQLNRSRSFRISFKELCRVLGEGASHKEDDFVKKMVETPNFWKIRPLTEEMAYYAAADAICLVPNVHKKLDGMLTPLWRHYFNWMCQDSLNSGRRISRK